MIDLETLSNMDVRTSEWKFPDKASAFKDKCFNVLLKRLGGIKYVVPDCDSTSMETFMVNDAGGLVDYTNVCVYDSNIDAMNQVLSESNPASVYITSSLLLNDIIDTDGRRVDQDDDSLEDFAESIMEEIPNYNYEFGDVYLDKDDIISAVKAFELVSQGKYDLALMDKTVSELAEGFSQLFTSAISNEQIITPEQVLSCLSVFLDLFLMNENWYAKVHVYSSTEIYAYNKEYREKVPEDVRKTVDKLIEIVSCPVDIDAEGLVSSNQFYDDERKTYIVVLELLEGGYDLQPVKDGDINGIFKSAVLTLAKELPKLRELYGQKAA